MKLTFVSRIDDEKLEIDEKFDARISYTRECGKRPIYRIELVGDSFKELEELEDKISIKSAEDGTFEGVNLRQVLSGEDVLIDFVEPNQNDFITEVSQARPLLHELTDEEREMKFTLLIEILM